MINVTPDRDLLSVGRLSELLQASPGQIEHAAEVAGVAISLRIDGRPYYCDAHVRSIREVLKRPEPRA